MTRKKKYQNHNMVIKNQIFEKLKNKTCHFLPQAA